MKKEFKPEICCACIADKEVFCPRDVDAKCLICGAEFCGAHITLHLREAHCVSLNLDHCKNAEEAKR